MIHDPIKLDIIGKVEWLEDAARMLNRSALDVDLDDLLRGTNSHDHERLKKSYSDIVGISQARLDRLEEALETIEKYRRRQHCSSWCHQTHRYF